MHWLFPQTDRRRVDAYLSKFLREAKSHYLGRMPLAPLFDRISDFALQGGKRLRPRLCLAGYRILNGKFPDADSSSETPSVGATGDPGASAIPIPGAVWRVAALLELLHAFMLVHDDLIDGSLTRRDSDALHESLRREPGFWGASMPRRARARKAEDMALLGGDLLFALGMRSLAGARLDAKRLSRVLRLLSDMLVETGLGEAVDLLQEDIPLDGLQEEEILEMYVRKTARYSVSGPLMLGAALAGAKGSVLRVLQRYGDLLGLIYQIQNDLDAFAPDLEHGDHPDLDGGKRTIVLWTAHDRLSPADRLALRAALQAPVGLARRRALWNLIQDSGAIAHCQDKLKRYQYEAVHVLASSPLTPRERELFTQLAETLTRLLSRGPAPAVNPVHAHVSSTRAGDESVRLHERAGHNGHAGHLGVNGALGWNVNGPG